MTLTLDLPPVLETRFNSERMRMAGVVAYWERQV
jgi:hypothetical protein